MPAHFGEHFVARFFLAAFLLTLASCGKPAPQGTAESIGGGGNYVSVIEDLVKHATLALSLVETGAYDEEICKDISGMSTAQVSVAKKFLIRYAASARKAIPSLKVEVTPDSLFVEDKNKVKHAVRAKLLSGNRVFLQQTDVDAGHGLELFLHETFHTADDLDDFTSTEAYVSIDGRQKQMDDSSKCAKDLLAKHFPYFAETKPVFASSGTRFIFKETIRATAIIADGSLFVVTAEILPGPDERYPRMQNRLRKFSPSGLLVETFGVSGVVVIPRPANDIIGANYIQGITITSDGSVVMAGRSQVYDLNFNGYLRHYSFKTNALGAPDTIYNSAVQADANNIPVSSGFFAVVSHGQKIVAAGFYADGTNSSMLVYRYNSDGSRDNSFGAYGAKAYSLRGFDVAYSLTVAPDGGYYLTGYAGVNGTPNYRFALVKITSDGTLDSSFDEDGKVTLEFPDYNLAWGQQMVVQPDGKLVVAGNVMKDTKATPLLLRFQANGILDAGFANGGKFLRAETKSASTSVVILLSDGKILCAGSIQDGAGSNAYLFRVTADGKPDATLRRGDQQGKIQYLVGPNSSIISGWRIPSGEIFLAGDVDIDGQRGTFLTQLYGETGI